MPATFAELDVIEEIRLRVWARQNYVEPEGRDGNWHPVVLEEMTKKELEMEPELAIAR